MREPGGRRAQDTYGAREAGVVRMGAAGGWQTVWLRRRPPMLPNQAAHVSPSNTAPRAQVVLLKIHVLSFS